MIDLDLLGDLADAQFEREVWSGISAKERTFNKVSFKRTRFENCYFRKCIFQDCDFTGAIFSDCSLRQSQFPGSKFHYCRFFRTIVEHDLVEDIDTYIPERENVQAELARNLRANYAQVGDTEGVNSAILAEVTATRVHYRKAGWPGGEEYYRTKYAGNRLEMRLKYLSFQFFDVLWGNGESLGKTVRSIALMVVFLGVLSTWGSWRFSFELAISSTLVVLWRTISRGLPLFFGVPNSPVDPRWLASTAAAMRLFVVALLTSVFVKRFGRR